MDLSSLVLNDPDHDTWTEAVKFLREKAGYPSRLKSICGGGDIPQLESSAAWWNKIYYTSALSDYISGRTQDNPLTTPLDQESQEQSEE